MNWLSIFLPLLPLEVFQHSETPVAIMQRGQVLLCNDAAKRCGVETGISSSTALALCNDVQLCQRDIEKERQTLSYLAESAYQFSSQVLPWQNLHDQHSLLLEVGSSLRLFGGLEALLKKISYTLCTHPLSRLGFAHYFGIASTIKAAELLARCNEPDSDKNPLLTEKALYKTSITQLDCEKKAIQQCIDMGLVKTGDILSLPVAALSRRFNQAFINYLDQLRGMRYEPQSYFVPTDKFQRELFYINGLISHGDLQQPMQQLLHNLCDFLQQRQWLCLGILWTFARFSKQKHTINVSFSKPMQQHYNMLSLSQLQLEQLPLDSPVESITLSANKFCPAKQQNSDLFSTQNQRGDFYLLADKLIAKLGSNSLWRVKTCDSHLPEQSSRLVKFKEKNKTRTSQHKGIVVGSEHLPRPVWLLPQPENLHSDGSQIFRQRQRIFILKGPERIEGHWWEETFSRDYFIAVEKDDCICKVFYWVFYDRLKNQWFLHGVFD